MIYLDTSVLGALYWPERMSSRAQAEVARSGQPPALTQLSEVELVSATSLRLRNGDLSRQDANRIVTLFLSHLRQGVFARLAIEPAHYSQARDWIARFDTSLRALDALHLAVADANRLRLVTADVVLSRAARALGVDALLLRP